MASKNVKYDNWLHIAEGDALKVPNPNTENLKVIDQSTLEYLMENILELSSEDAYNSNENVISNEYSQISSPLVKSISSSSSEKLESNERIINGSEWLWYWSSRPEITNFYNSNKSANCETFEQINQDLDTHVNVEVQSFDFRSWLYSYLPVIYSHACTFILGAATMYFILKRCMQMTTNNII